MSVPGIINDPFSFAQSSNTTISYQAGQWTPLNSSRQVQTAGSAPSGAIFGDINQSGNDAWRIGARVSDRSGAPSADIFSRLFYIPAPGTFFNISNLQSFTLNNFTPSSTDVNLSPFIRMYIDNNDGDLFQTSATRAAPNTTGSAVNVIFNLTTIPGSFNKTNVTQIEFELRVNTQNFETGTATYLATVESITTIEAIICLAKDTNILMADGTNKFIQDIERGDLVAQNRECNSMAVVARVLHSQLPSRTPVSLMKIKKSALDVNLPENDTIISSGHPILYKDSRYRAKAFKNLNDIKYYGRHKTEAKDILPANEDGTFSLYNIQFEHDGYFVANGLIVDSFPPLSCLKPLPRELYFDDKLYENPVKVIKPVVKKKFIKD